MDACSDISPLIIRLAESVDEPLEKYIPGLSFGDHCQIIDLPPHKLSWIVPQLLLEGILSRVW